MQNNSFNNKYTRIILALLLILFVGMIINRAWLCDDSYITFRVVDNAVNGYRLTWNTDEKVQIFTHPLWMLLEIPIYFVLRNPYLVIILLSLAVSIAAAALLGYKVARSAAGGILALLALTFSNAYVDYSTSGLENPLTHLLLVLFFWIYFRMEKGIKKLFWLSLVSSLGMLNRMDTALLYFPPLAYAFFRLERKDWLKGFLLAVVGQGPFLTWEVFATLYYGFPVPNTAYSKITGVFPWKIIFDQAMWYFGRTLRLDTLTLAVIIPVTLGVLWKRKKSLLPLAVSIMLYLAYTIYLGGDSYLGRFFTAPLLIAAVMLSQLDYARTKKGIILAGAAGILALGLAAPMPVFLIEPPARNQELYNTGGHSRLHYSPVTRFLRNGRINTEVEHRFADEAAAAREENPKQVIKFASVGFFGFYAGPQIHVLDTVGLGDALLARMPPRHRGIDFWPGHLYRDVPDGYMETLESNVGANLITDKNLAEYYEHLKIITEGSTFSGERLAEIWKVNTGAYDALIDFNTYRYPDAARISCSDSGCNEGGQPVSLGMNGALLLFERPVYPEQITFEVDEEGQYDYELSLDEEALLLDDYTVTSEDNGQFEISSLPASVRKKGINKIFILPFDKKSPHALVKVTIK